MSSADRFNQFEQFKAEAAEQLGLPLDADQVRLLATLKLSHENLLERLMRGDNVNPDQVRSVVEAISAMLPPAQVKLPKFQWASSVVGIYRCQHCNEINRLEESQYVAHPATPQPRPPKAAQPAEPVSVAEQPPHPPPPPKPLHERLAKDSRPNAPGGSNGAGSLCWSGSAPSSPISR